MKGADVKTRQGGGKWGRGLAWIGSLLLLSAAPGCGAGGATNALGGTVSQTKPPEWPSQNQAIKITYRADTQLNLFNDRAHTLALYVVQFSDPNSFKTLSADASALQAFLEKAGTGDATVVDFRQIVVHPGDYTVRYLDRAQGAQWVAVIAGYYYLDPPKVTRLYEIPLVNPPSWRDSGKVPGKIAMGLVLGPRAILQSQKFKE